ncbi:MAG: bifunctional phosphopantothenoylcysteine decarboxylase/phosphopantothenate--cysteine ligase CoaBC, partial [Sediminibacterium sp.]|nr:bifunctional phosphopantothenoylcysteine decarboxylase/phosphopantothenate--cysteine ligase CoaBC [Sediminibacterium sp.]
MLQNKKIIVGICGGIAAYKSIILVRELVKLGAEVKVIITPNAVQFVSPLVLSTISKNKVSIHLFEDNVWENHVALGLWADLFIIAPLTCNTLAKLAMGISDNLLVATYLSAKCPVIIAPAMDEDMWHHPSTQENIGKLIQHNVHIIPVNYGELASGLIGLGRMAEPAEIILFLQENFCRTAEFKNKKILISAGPTKEKIDPVRYISNFSSGKMGLALAEAFYEKGGEVIIISGKETLKSMYNGIQIFYVETTEDMFNACKNNYTNMDYIIMSAAVADYTPLIKEHEKIKKQSNNIQIELTKTMDILKFLGDHKQPNQTLIG